MNSTKARIIEDQLKQAFSAIDDDAPSTSVSVGDSIETADLTSEDILHLAFTKANAEYTALKDELRALRLSHKEAEERLERRLTKSEAALKKILAQMPEG